MNLTGKTGMNKLIVSSSEAQSEDKSYLFDTYAFFEVIRGNPNYNSYINSKIITTIFNIAELNYNLKKEKDRKIADEYTEKYFEFVVEVTLEDVKKAMDFKSLNRKLSIPDAIGYIIAKKYNVRFLTGDKDFEYIDNVEYVK